MKPTVRWIYMGWFLLSAYLEALTCLKKWWRFWMTGSLESRFKNFSCFSWSYYLLDVSGSDSSWSWVSSFSKLLVFYSLLGTHHHFRFLTLVPKEKLRKSWKYQWLSFAVGLEVQWVPARSQAAACFPATNPRDHRCYTGDWSLVDDSPKLIKGSAAMLRVSLVSVRVSMYL